MDADSGRCIVVVNQQIGALQNKSVRLSLGVTYVNIIARDFMPKYMKRKLAAALPLSIALA